MDKVHLISNTMKIDLISKIYCFTSDRVIDPLLLLDWGGRKSCSLSPEHILEGWQLYKNFFHSSVSFPCAIKVKSNYFLLVFYFIKWPWKNFLDLLLYSSVMYISKQFCMFLCFLLGLLWYLVFAWFSLVFGFSQVNWFISVPLTKLCLLDNCA